MTNQGTCERCGGTILARARSGAPRGTCACQLRSRSLAGEEGSPGVSQPAPAQQPGSPPQAGSEGGHITSAATPPASQGGTAPSGWVPIHATPVRLDIVGPGQSVMLPDGRVVRTPVAGLPPETPVQVCTNVWPSRGGDALRRSTMEEG